MTQYLRPAPFAASCVMRFPLTAAVVPASASKRENAVKRPRAFFLDLRAIPERRAGPGTSETREDNKAFRCGGWIPGSWEMKVVYLRVGWTEEAREVWHRCGVLAAPKISLHPRQPGQRGPKNVTQEPGSNLRRPPISDFRFPFPAKKAIRKGSKRTFWGPSS